MIKDIKFELFEQKDKEEIFKIMRIFYSSPFLINKPSDRVIKNDIEACLNKDIPLEGYKVVYENEIVGYFMLSFSYSTEFGCMCVWFEDLYLREEFRNKHIGTKIFDFVFAKYPKDKYRIRLEVEKNNIRAIGLYTKCGFKENKYIHMDSNPKYE